MVRYTSIQSHHVVGILHSLIGNQIVRSQLSRPVDNKHSDTHLYGFLFSFARDQFHRKFYGEISMKKGKGGNSILLSISNCIQMLQRP